jgi:uncharacterized protein YukE
MAQVPEPASPTPSQIAAPIVVPLLWSLNAQPLTLARAATAWRDLASGATSAHRSLETTTRALLAAWEGGSADAYQTHSTQVSRTLVEASTVAGQLANAIDDVAGIVGTAQSHLDDSWRRIRRAVPATVTGDDVVFTPADHTAATRVAAAVAEAGEIRSHADAQLHRLAETLHRLRWHLWTHASELQAKESEDAPWVDGTPELASGGRVIVDGNRVIVNGTAWNDDVRVSVDPRTGEQIVTMIGTAHRFPANADLVLRTGAGNDTITVAPGSRVRVTLIGGGGDDRIRGGDGADTILGNWGRDTIEAGAGQDRVSGGADGDYLDGQRGGDAIDGGLGDDTLYGLDGDDKLWGGHGRDYLDGGTGSDLIAGDAGSDVGAGGRDSDRIHGGAGDDVLYAGAGKDHLDGGAGTDRAYAQREDVTEAAETEVTVELSDAAGFVRIEGSADFVTRVQSDLDALRGSERGAEMLRALQQSRDDSVSAVADWPILGSLASQGHTLTIREIDVENGFASQTRYLNGQVDATIEYSPRWDDFRAGAPVPPVVVLYHELAHVYDYFHNTLAEGDYIGSDNPGVPNLERAAAGLPIDHDGDPSTPYRLDPDHPLEYTENGMREELGRFPRLRY